MSHRQKTDSAGPPARTPRPRTAALILAAAVAASCGDQDDDHDHDHEEDICEHLAAAAITVTASATTATPPPEIEANHRRYEIGLPASASTGGSGERTGYVSFKAARGGKHVFVTSEAVTLRLTGASGEVSPTERASQSAACAAIKGRSAYSLQVGTYVLEVRATVDKVSFVVEAPEGP
jgi:hypothetical protein